jgi:hypothetical protein
MAGLFEAGQELGLIPPEVPEEEWVAKAKQRFELDWQQHVARVYDLPPWLLASDYPAPRFPRLRWRLRRVWPLRARSNSC